MHLLGIEALDRVINELSRLPGIGHKTAQRLAIFILKSDSGYAENLRPVYARNVLISLRINSVQFVQIRIVIPLKFVSWRIL